MSSTTDPGLLAGNRKPAVGYQAKLHAALLGYLAAAGAVQPGDVSFGMASKDRMGDGFMAGDVYVTAADAAAIGL